MLKSIQTLLKQDKEMFVVPRRVQDLIPVQRIWPDGIFQVGPNKFSKTWKFSDINYQVASEEDKENMFLLYSDVLNSFDSAATTKITVNNHRLNKKDFENSILMQLKGDRLDVYREEYNNMLLEKATGANGITQEKYITVSINKKSVEDARTYFARTGADLQMRLSSLGSSLEELDATEKLRILHDFYRQGEEVTFEFDMNKKAALGHDFRDYICPDTIERKDDYIKLGEKFVRVLFLKDYGNYISDDIIAELTDMNRNLMLSIDVLSVPTDEAIREVENKLLGVETNITNWQRKQNQNNNFSAVIPYDMELQRNKTKEFLADLTTRDQRMMLGLITIAISSDSKEQLDLDTEALQSVAKGRHCQMAVLKWQQADGLNTALPFGVRKIDCFRTLNTESLAVFLPFKTQEIMDKGGIYYGENAISHNLIMCNKENLLNQSAFLLGVPGSGKSFSAKELITFLMLNTDDDILICDPEGEYAPLVEAMGPDMGSVIRVSAGGRDRLNAMYMVDGYGENDPIVVKSQFIMSLVEQIDKKGVGPQQKSIIDRCAAAVYRDAERCKSSGGATPTLCTFREKLLEQPEPEAKQIALSLELFTTGSLDIFGRESNVDMDKRVVVFDIHGLGSQLKPTGLLVITDTMLNRVTLNWKKGKRTHVFIDEFHVVFENEFSAQFFNSAWRQFRKRNAYPTAITQNVEYLLDSVQASTMLSNSEFVIMLNQAASDRAKLAKLLNIPRIQNKASSKEFTEIAEQKETTVSIPMTAPVRAARRAGIAAIRHARTMSQDSGKQEDQEAIDNLEASAKNTAADTADALLDARDSLKSRIKKKRPDIKNTRDIKSGARTINKADRSIKSATEATRVAAKSAQEAAKQAAITSQKVVSAKKAEQLAKKSAEWVKKIVKGIIEGLKRLGAALGAASVPLLLILVLAGLIAGIVASAFGIFFAGDVSGENTRTLQEVVLEINGEYNGQIEQIKTNTAHDELVMEGYQAPWPDVLSVYAVYVTTRTDGATDVVHLTDDNVNTLKTIFWQMNTITSYTETKTETIQVPDLDEDGNQKKDEDGNLLYKEETITTIILHITIGHLSASEEASNLSFNSDQTAQLNELLDVRYASLWAQVLRGVGGSNELVNLALSQLGNEGGEKFWRWAGLDSRCAWCALFVSWCADQTGLLGTQIPYFSFVSDGVSWFKSHDKWIDGSEVNSSNYDKVVYPGMIIFFDWEPDGNPNHVGIVTKVANGYIYTVEGNSSDAVRERSYSANSDHIFGFGIVG